MDNFTSPGLSSKQCAAVKTQFSEIRIPPQNWPYTPEALSLLKNKS